MKEENEIVWSIDMDAAKKIIEVMTASARESVIKNEGGMDNFTETLQDSDTFYQEAKALGKLEALEELQQSLENGQVSVSIENTIDKEEEYPLAQFKMK